MVPPPPPSPNPTCVRCSKPIRPGTASQIAGRPLHMRCHGQATQLKSIEQQDRASLERLREELMDAVPLLPTTCAVCGERLGTSRGVLFQGNSLVHAACWRADPPRPAEPPAG